MEVASHKLPYTNKLTWDPSVELSNKNFFEELKEGTQLELRSKEQQLDSVVANPEPKIFAHFASKAYTDKEQDETELQYEARLQLPSGWEILTTSNNLAFKGTVHGYFGKAFWHPENRWIVIAHRGTVPSNPDALLRADVNGIFRNQYVKQMNAACTFTHKLYEAIKKCEEEKQTHFDIFFTGHSLGAWLAQVTTFSLKYLKLQKETFLKNPNPDGGYHAHTVVFDSPGCCDMLLQLAKDFDVRYSGKSTKLESLDITTYLSSPNFVNCCNLHVGRLYRVYPKIASDQFVKYTLSAHSMNGILETINTSDPLLIKEVVDWPKIEVTLWQWKIWKMPKTILGKEYEDFFHWTKDLNYEPKPEDVTFKVFVSSGDDNNSIADEFVIIRYQTKSARANECSSSIFTEYHLKFLRKFQQLRILPNSIFDGYEITKELENKIKNRLQQLIIDEESVKCDKNSNVLLLISYAKTLLRFYPNLNERVELALTDFEVRKQIYRDITDNYLRKMEGLTQILLEPDWPKLVKFLENEYNQVCQVLAEIGTDFAVAKALKIISVNLLGVTIFAFELQSLLNTETFFHLTEFLKSVNLNQTLIIIECKSGSLANPENLLFVQGIINPIKERPHLKLIVITDKNETLLLKNNDLENVTHEGITWNELTNETKRRIVTKNVVIFQGDQDRISLEKILRCSDTVNLTQVAEMIDLETLAKFVKDEDVIIGEGLTIPGHIYIPRNFTYKPYVKEDIFNDAKHVDIVAVSGLNLKVIDNKFRDGIKCGRFKTIKTEQEFESLCQIYPGKNIHWLKVESNLFVFHKTRGNLKLIRKLIDEHILEYTEKTLIENMNGARKTVVISDVPGMGKSTVLSILARKIKDEDPIKWVKRINLNDCAEILGTAIKNHIRIETVLDATKFLLENLLPNCSHFERKLFERALITNGGVVLIFDGFDEISPDYEQIVSRLLELLQKTNVEKLLVTTRPHTKKQLEDRLGVLSHVMVPFTKENQKEFLIEIWKKRLNGEVSIEDLEKYAEQSVTFLEKSIKDRDKTFLGVPLQCVLLAEYVIRIILHGKVEDLEALSLIDLHEAFVQSKTNIYYNEKTLITDGNLSDENHKKLMNVSKLNMHREYALKLILSEGTWEELEYPEIENELKEITENEVLKAGLMLNTGNNPQFLHRTFAEFFVLDYALSLTKNTKKNWKKLTILSREILLKREFGVIRTFLESVIKKENRDEETKSLLRSFVEFWKENWLNNRLACVNQDEESVLHLLIEENRESTFKKILFLMIEVCPTYSLLSFATNNGTALHTAVWNGNTNITRMILDHNRDITSTSPDDERNNSSKDTINAIDIYGWTALHVASNLGQPRLVSILLENGADINARDNDESTPLMDASSQRHLETIRVLLEKGANTEARNNHGSTPLIESSYKGHLEIVRLLLEKGADINARNKFKSTPLLEASSEGHLEVVRLLIEKGADINARNKIRSTALIEASSERHLEIVRLLLDKGADINASDNRGFSALIEASAEGYLEIVRLLLEKGADVNARNSNGSTPLLESLSFERHVDLDINAHDEPTPLKSEPYNGQLETARLLLEMGAYVNSSNAKGSTALQNASRLGHLRFAEFLISNGANVNSVDKFDRTPLHDASYNGHANLVLLLLQNGANVDFPGSYKTTPLHLAAKAGHLEIVRVLLRHGANPLAKNRSKRTPLNLAIALDRSEIIEELSNHEHITNSINTPQSSIFDSLRRRWIKLFK